MEDKIQALAEEAKSENRLYVAMILYALLGAIKAGHVRQLATLVGVFAEQSAKSIRSQLFN